MMTEATRELRKQRTILGVLERAKSLLEQQGKRYVTIERMRGMVIVLTYDDNGKMWGKDVNFNTFNRAYKQVFPNLPAIEKLTKYLLTPSSYANNEFAEVEKTK